MTKTMMIAFAVLLLFTGGLTTHAQEDDIPFPPDPSEIFAEGVEVIDMRIPQDVHTQRFVPEPAMDIQNRFIRVYHRTSDTWGGLPYPEGTPEDSHPFLSYWNGSDGDYYVFVSGVGAWLIDDETFEYIPLALVCGNEVPALPGFGTWIVYNDEETERAYLCFTETGEFSVALPSELMWYSTTALPIGYQLNEPQLSPNGDRLIVVGQNTDESGRPVSYAIYSYTIEDDQLIALGTIERESGFGEPPVLDAWVSDTQGLIHYAPAQENLIKMYYAFDVTRENSVELMTQGWMYRGFNALYQRYENMITNGLLTAKAGGTLYPPSPHVPCQLDIYDANGPFHHELGYDCAGANFVSAGDYVYTVRIDSNPAQFSALIRVNVYTGEITELMTGSYEGILAVTPDNHYVVLAVGSGEIDRVDFYATDPANMPPVETANIIVFDLETGEQVQSLGSRILWNGISRLNCGENCYIVTLDNIYSVDIPTYVIFHPSGEIDSLSTPIFRPSLDGTHFLVEIGNLVYVANFAEGTMTPLEITQDVYEMRFTWSEVDEEIIYAHVSLPRIGITPLQSATFSLRVP